MKEISIFEAQRQALQKILDDRAMFYTAEHLLQPVLEDPQVRIMLVGLEVDLQGLTDRVREYLAEVPRWKGKMGPPVQSPTINRIFARLRSKEQELQHASPLCGSHFIEAYAKDAWTDGGVPPPKPALFLRHWYSEIAVHVYPQPPTA